MIAPDFGGVEWRKSTRSHGGGGACVMVAQVPGAAGVRDSKLGEASPVLPFTADAWASFLRDVKVGTFDVA